MRAQAFAAELDRLGPDGDNHYGRDERHRDDAGDQRETRPERLPLFPPLPPAAPYPLDALGPILGEAASAIARKVQAPAAIAAQSVLAAASLAVRHANVSVGLHGQRRPLSLYLVSSASSGDRKSTTDNEALWPVSWRARRRPCRCRACCFLGRTDAGGSKGCRRTLPTSPAKNGLVIPTAPLGTSDPSQGKAEAACEAADPSRGASPEG
jgi:hypothetical protein